MKTSNGRGFSYPLESLLAKSEWDLLEIKLRLRSANDAVDQERNRVEGISFELAAERDAGAATGRCGLDSVATEVLSMRWTYLELLSQRLRSAECELAAAERAQADVQVKAMNMQRFTDGMERHREGELRAHISLQTSKAGKEADDSWAQRRHFCSQRAQYATAVA